MKRTTETLLEAYLIRQRWQEENYPNKTIEQQESKTKDHGKEKIKDH